MTPHVPVESGLVYYPDSEPGIRRERRGRGFSYVAADGTRIRCPDKRREIEAIAVPPAYEQVWISPLPNGHLRASGRDDRERKQYIYHPDWIARQEAAKYDRLTEVGRGLPRLRRWIERHLRGPAGALDTSVAAGLALIDRLSLRVGEPAYTEENGSHGVTTLEPRHLRRGRDGTRLRFPAKGGRTVDRVVTGPRLQEVLKASRRAGGATLLCWADRAGEILPLRADHLNARIADLCGDEVTAKSLRTWNGTHAAFLAARSMDKPTIAALAEEAARRLDNTPAVARSSYIHPAVLEAATEGHLTAAKAHPQRRGLRRGEAALLQFLQDTPRLAEEIQTT